MPNQTDYSSAVIADTPWVFYKMDDASGNPVDSSGNARNISSIDGSFSYAQTGPFTGSKSTIGTNTLGSQFNRLSPPNAVVSVAVEMWVKLGQTPGSNARAFFAVGNSTSGFYMTYDTNGTFKAIVRTGIGDTALTSSTASLSTSSFSHIVVTREGGTWKYYVNAVLDTANAGTLQMNDPSAQVMNINALYAADYKQYVSNFAYYTASLSAAQVVSHYNAAISALDSPASASAITHYYHGY